MTGFNNKKDWVPKESPTNVRNGKELIKAANDAFDNNRCRTAVIQPQGRAFYMGCRMRSFYDFRTHLAMTGRGTGNAARWLGRSLVDNIDRFAFQSSAAPQPLSTARFHLGPAVAKLLKELLISEAGEIDTSNDGKVIYLLLFEGLSGRSIQMFCTAYSAGEAASVAFYQLANGYSMVFAGITLKESYRDRYGFGHNMTYHTCSTIQELETVAKDQPRPIGSYGTKDVIGIIY